MTTEEKHSAIWVPSTADGRIVFEEYDRSRDVLAVVFQQPGGWLKAVVFEKSRDPQRRLPFWSERRPEALFDRREDALIHLAKLREGEGIAD